MNKLLISIIALLSIILSLSCRLQAAQTVDSIRVHGRLLYSPDRTPLRGGVINRVSDGKAFLPDNSGDFNVMVQPCDSLRFSFVGTIGKTVAVTAKDTSMIVSLDPYIPGNDEYVVRQESLYPEMEVSLKTYVHDKDARIGVAVIINGTDTVSVNGNRDFPMLSVYKFPQAIAVADYCNRHKITLNDSIRISAGDLKPNTWSPMRDKYGRKDISLPLSEVLAYSVQQSDNNACDVLFRLIGGPQVADSLMKSIGYDEIHILNTEAELHIVPYLCYANRATPLQMAALFDRFYRLEMRHDTHMLEAVGAMMMQCNTGNNRLPLPLMPTNAVIGHKTGTGDRNSQGRIIGVNDSGYVFLPNKQGYAIAVFIADSGYDMAETEKMIADISEIVFKSLMVQEAVLGEYKNASDGSTLTISKKENGRIKVEIGLTRLTTLDDGLGALSDNGLSFSATDVAGNPIYGEIVIEGNTAKLTFIQSTWEYLPDGTTFEFQRK